MERRSESRPLINPSLSKAKTGADIIGGGVLHAVDLIYRLVCHGKLQRRTLTKHPPKEEEPRDSLKIKIK